MPTTSYRYYEAYPLAVDIGSGISGATGMPDRGVFARPSLYVLRKTRMPATLIETGFITTQSEADLLKNSPELFAQGMYNGIRRYFGFEN